SSAREPTTPPMTETARTGSALGSCSTAARRRRMRRGRDASRLVGARLRNEVGAGRAEFHGRLAEQFVQPRVERLGRLLDEHDRRISGKVVGTFGHVPRLLTGNLAA